MPAYTSDSSLYFKVSPRYNIYLASEKTGSFLVDALLSHTHELPYRGTAVHDASGSASGVMTIEIRIDAENCTLVEGFVSTNSSSNVFDFDLQQLTPRISSYKITLYGTFEGSKWTYTATTDLYYLPEKTTGSVTKVDNLNGGLLFRNNATGAAFTPIFPFGFYTDYGGYLANGTEYIQAYADYGFSAIHPIPSYDSNASIVFDYMDEINLPFQYDMRHTYQNITSVTEQVQANKDRSALLLWYTGDEPDGQQDPLNATTIAYNTIASLDKYHPVSLVLNCKDYYFGEYGKGADILLEDAYPVGINATYSKWGTVCNSTYGDCGCDDCKGHLSDISDRLDDFANYQDRLGWWRKPTWAVQQAFYGDGYWPRLPTADETYAMNVLSINHGAKGIISWSFPQSGSLSQAHATQARVFTKTPVLHFLLGTQPVKIEVRDHDLLDVAYWIVGDQAMIGISNLDYADTSSMIFIVLPFKASSLQSQPWGSLEWVMDSDDTLSAPSLPGLATSLVILDL